MALQQYKATTTGIYRAGTTATNFFHLLADPFNAAPASKPDDDPTPHVLRSVVYNQNYTPPVANAAGMVVYPTASMKQAIRIYGYDPTSQTMNFVQNLFPDQLLSENFVRGRPLAAALKVFSNTLASGNFALSGSINAIPYVALPPLNSIQPGTLTTYRMDDISVVSNVSAMEGVAMVGPLYGNATYDVFDTLATPSRSIDLAITNQRYSVTTSAGSVRVNNSWYVGGADLGNNAIPTPLPWGRGRAEVTVQIEADAANLANLQGYVEIVVGSQTANPATYVQNIVLNQLNSLGVNLAPGTSESITLIWDQYLDPEYYNINVNFVQTSVGQTADITSIANYFFSDYYRYATTEPGVIALFQNITANQQLSISGVSHWEVIPNQVLAQNLKSIYSLDDPNHYVAAVLSLVSRMGAPYKWVYPRLEYEALVQQGAFLQSAESHFMRAATYRASFWDVLKGVGRAIAAPALATVGGFVGGPAGAMIGNTIGTALARPYTGRASTTRYRCATQPIEIYNPLPCPYDQPDQPMRDIEDLCEKDKCDEEEQSFEARARELAEHKVKCIRLEDLGTHPYRASGRGKRARLESEDPNDQGEGGYDPMIDEENPVPQSAISIMPTTEAQTSTPNNVDYQDYLEIFRKKKDGRYSYMTDKYKGVKIVEPFNTQKRLQPAIANRYTWALCALAVGEKDQEQGLLAHIILTAKPLAVKRLLNNNPVSNYLTYNTILDQIHLSANIEEADANPSFWGLLAPLLTAWGAVYVSLVPFQAPILGVAGRSYEFAIIAAALGLPADNIYTGANDPGTVTAELFPKAYMARDYNRVIFISNPDQGELTALNAALEPTGNTIDVNFPLNRVSSPVGFAGTTGDLCPLALLTAAVGQQKITKTAPSYENESITSGRVAQNEVEEMEKLGRMTIAKKVYTKEGVMADTPLALAKMEGSEYYHVVGAEAWSTIKKKAEKPALNWRALAHYIDNFNKWTEAKAKAKKPAARKDKNAFLAQLARMKK